MAVNTKEIKRRLQSIKNTKKITKTMEMVSAAKMRRAVNGTLSSRPYHGLAMELASRLRKGVVLNEGDELRRFFAPAHEDGHVTILMITSNRGLCGSLNSNVIKKVLEVVKGNSDARTDILALGKRGLQTLTSLGVTVELAYEKDDLARDDAQIREISDYLYKKFADEKTDRVLIMYTHFESAVSQRPVIVQLYPFVGLENGIAPENAKEEFGNGVDAYIYEPGKRDILEYLIPRVGEAMTYQAVLESNASEHSARMVSMKNATDAAGDMVDELVLEFNKARQALITREIAEISAGTAAVA